MDDFIAPFLSLPGYGIGGVVVLLLYAIEAELRFGSRARTMRTEASDRGSTLALSLSAAVPVLGFVAGIKAGSANLGWFPSWFRGASLPGLPATAWTGVFLGVIGLGLRLWAVLTLRERYTRTLLVQEQQLVERRGPYSQVRHPGYLGSLLCLNGIALASGNWITLIASLVATLAAYSYRIKVEDAMLVHSLGRSYIDYQREVGALIPWPRASRLARSDK